MFFFKNHKIILFLEKALHEVKASGLLLSVNIFDSPERVIQ